MLPVCLVPCSFNSFVRSLGDAFRSGVFPSRRSFLLQGNWFWDLSKKDITTYKRYKRLKCMFCEGILPRLLSRKQHETKVVLFLFVIVMELGGRRGGLFLVPFVILAELMCRLTQIYDGFGGSNPSLTSNCGARFLNVAEICAHDKVCLFARPIGATGSRGSLLPLI